MSSISGINSKIENQAWLFTKKIIVDFLYHLMNVFTNCSMNIDQLIFKLLEVTLVVVRKSLKFLLLRNQVPIVGQSMNNRNCVYKLLYWWKLPLMKLLTAINGSLYGVNAFIPNQIYMLTAG
jgi:hypothetical protein